MSRARLAQVAIFSLSSSRVSILSRFGVVVGVGVEFGVVVGVGVEFGVVDIDGRVDALFSFAELLNDVEERPHFERFPVLGGASRGVFFSIVIFFVKIRCRWMLHYLASDETGAENELLGRVIYDGKTMEKLRVCLKRY